MDAREWFTGVRVLPVVGVTDADAGVALAEALLEGGIDVIEVTLRHPSALEAIRRIGRARLPIKVAAGSIQSPADCERAIAAGASLLVSPGATAALLEYAAGAAVPLLPGVATPSEALSAAAFGFQTVKVFPIAALGGVATLRAWSAPMPALGFVPSGGVTAASAPAYLAEPSVRAIGVSFLTAAPSDPARITQRARAARDGHFDSMG